MANKKRLSFRKGYLFTPDGGCREKTYYIWRILSPQKGIEKQGVRELGKYLKSVNLLLL